MNTRSSKCYGWMPLLLTAIGLLSACISTRPVDSCDDFLAAPRQLQQLSYGNAKVPDVRQWVLSTYELDSTAVVEGERDLRWNIENGEVYADFRNGALKGATIRWTQAPSLQRVLDCLGSPDYYEAAIKPDHRPRFDFTLWYLREGLMVYSASYGKADVDAIDMNDKRPMETLFVTAPGSLEEVVRSVYMYESTVELPNSLTNTIRPWPGNLNRIVVDNLWPE